MNEDRIYEIIALEYLKYAYELSAYEIKMIDKIIAEIKNTDQ